MRALLLSLLVGGLVFWWFGSGGSASAEESSAAGAADQGAVPPSAGAGGLDRMLAGASPGPGRASAPDLSAEATPPAPAPLPELAELLPALQQKQPDAYAAAWTLLVRATAADKGRLLAALAPSGEEFAALVATLGTHNAFLHSTEGRGAAEKAVAAMSRLADPEAAAAGTQLLGLMLRGRIERGDVEARKLVDETYRQHRIRVDRWLCDPANVAGARSYTVQKGDSLARIAKKFREEKLVVEEGTLAILNRIHNPNAIQVGQKIKVPVAPLSAVLEKRSYGLAIYVGEYLLRLYWVGHGEHDRTPVTEFTVGVKQPRPDWTAPDGQVYGYGHPKNILGEYFIKFVHDTYVGFGAHGTPMPETICTMSSMGCIRMLAPDIAELFRLLPSGAKVSVRATESR